MNNNIVMSGSMWRFLVIMLICSLSFIWAEDKQTSSAVANKAYKDNNKYVTTPFFYLQAGAGFAFNKKLAERDSTISEGVLPNFTLALGYNQHFNIFGVSMGFKLQVGYEMGLRTLDVNTEVYKVGGGFLNAYVGYWRIMLYGGAGYEIMERGQSFSPILSPTGRNSSYGPAYDCGLIVVFSKHNALDISMRFSKVYDFAPRILFNYEFRF